MAAPIYTATKHGVVGFSRAIAVSVLCVCVCEDVQHLKILCPSVLLSVSHVCVFKCVCMWVCMCTCVCMCVCIHVCVCAYVCVHQGASEASGDRKSVV